MTGLPGEADEDLMPFHGGLLGAGRVGLGCMNLSHGYGTPPSKKEAVQLLHRALDEGITHFDTAAVYGSTANESLLGEALYGRRQDVFIASKCGLLLKDGVRAIDGRAESLTATCNEALQRLKTDYIDLYYLHRLDRNVPIEESVGALSGLVREGKVRYIGLSEVSATMLKRAHSVHPITALQSEYSVWTREPEIATLRACRELGTSFVAFSPLGRGFLGGQLLKVSELSPQDIRRSMPRFSTENFSGNLSLFFKFRALAEEAECSPAQLALAWLLHQNEHVVAIPGTTNLEHLRENLAAGSFRICEGLLHRVGRLINERTVLGSRYNAQALVDVDTETFPEFSREGRGAQPHV